MTEADHRELLDTIRQSRSKILLSGYANDLYDKSLANWNHHTLPVPNHASG
jgi:hypothetical protein